MSISDNSIILEALNHLDPAELSYDEWLKVGMAMKNEGYTWQDWDVWSLPDSRYEKDLCRKKWETFKGSFGSPVTGGSIVQMAKDRGFQPHGSRCLEWGDEISYDGCLDSSAAYAPDIEMSPAEELKEYLSVLFEPDDIVGYVTTDVWKNKEGRYLPSTGAYDRTAGELIASLEKYPDDIGATVGDWNRECGGWIRFNPLDGKGVKNENVTKYRYALVESDTAAVAEQDAVYRKLELPIAALVFSGGKSLHAIVRIDADSYGEYRKRVEFLYDFLDRNGVTVDRQNRNPSRLSRMPGLTRNGNRQYLAATNIGRKSWADWLDFVEGIDDELPEVLSFGEYYDNLPPLPEELIAGVLRCGHKMLISGSSKAGKSFLLMELCIALAEGLPWLGFQCRKSKVMYVNLEIDPASCLHRFRKIYDAFSLIPEHADDIVIWNLRGEAVPLDKLVPVLVRRVKNQGFDAIIFDPIYKVITGDENSAAEMAFFCNQFDKVAKETGCSCIYAHHHSKGAQGAKRAIDRASGSGVFARDPDAQLDMIQLELSEDQKNNLRDGDATAWRLEGSLREFPTFPPVNFWFEYPIHRLDNENLVSAPAEGSELAFRAKNKKCTTEEERRRSLETAYEACSFETPVTLSNMAEYLGVSERCVRDRLKENEDIFWLKHGVVGKK